MHLVDHYHSIISDFCLAKVITSAEDFSLSYLVCVCGQQCGGGGWGVDKWPRDS